MRKISLLILSVVVLSSAVVADDDSCPANFLNTDECVRHGGFLIEIRCQIDIQNHKECIVKYIRKRAERGDAEAQHSLGKVYDERGIMSGKDDTGRITYYSMGVERDESEALRWYYAAAEQGNADAKYSLGLMHYKGKGIAKDYGETLRWYRAAAEQGHVLAQNSLGLMYYNGDGVARNYSKAMRWYRAAAVQGNAYAQNSLGLMYYNGDGVAKNYSKAMRWYRAAAEQENALAQYVLGLMYYNGDGVARNYGDALRWYRAAAEQENAAAQYVLGLMYYNGEGVESNYGEAFRWFRAAAEKKYAKAQYKYNLGVVYYNGDGVARDYGEALRWYRAAAEQGHALAQNNLGLMYYNGKGVVEDEREAYVWLLIAKASGSDNAEKFLQKISWQLTFAEIKSAKRKASRRFEKIENRNNNAQNPDTSQKSSGEYALAKPPKQKNIAAKVFENTWRSVVMIKNSAGQGGGVVIRPNLVATNCHVIEDGGDIVVYKPENRRITEDSPFDAEVVHRNEAHDFCILEVEGLWAVPVTIRKYETLQVGEGVYALGAPHGLDLSLSEGLISQLRKSDEGLRFIQTDAAISPGSSGGGLFDVDGNFIGILTIKYASEDTEGIGFAIPADLSLEY